MPPVLATGRTPSTAPSSPPRKISESGSLQAGINCSVAFISAIYLCAVREERQDFESQNCLSPGMGVGRFVHFGIACFFLPGARRI